MWITEGFKPKYIEDSLQMVPAVEPASTVKKLCQNCGRENDKFHGDCLLRSQGKIVTTKVVNSRRRKALVHFTGDWNAPNCCQRRYLVFDVAWKIMAFKVLFNRKNRCKCFHVDWVFSWLAIPIETCSNYHFTINADSLTFSSFVTNQGSPQIIPHNLRCTNKENISCHIFSDWITQSSKIGKHHP